MQSLLGDFAWAWECFFARTYPRKNEVPDGIEIRPSARPPVIMEIYRAQLEAIRRAKSIYLYRERLLQRFLDPPRVIRARQRGWMCGRAAGAKRQRRHADEQSDHGQRNGRHGIRVYAYPGMTHVKAAIYDGWACVGSANLENMSLRVSQELDVAFTDPATVNKLKHDLFEADFLLRPGEMTEPVQMNWLDSFVKAFADQL